MSCIAPLHLDPKPGIVCVEVTSSFQIPAFQIIGLAAREVSESRERVRAAIEAMGYEFPRRRIVVNLSPAWIPKGGTGFDLPIALAVMSHTDHKVDNGVMAWGELALDGKLRSVGQITRTVLAASDAGIQTLLLPLEDLANAQEVVRLLSELNLKIPHILCCATLADALNGQGTPVTHSTLLAPTSHAVQLEATALLPLPNALERAVLVSSIGDHHLLLLGPKGAGKSHALEWIRALSSPPDARTEIERRLVAELAGPQADRWSHSAQGISTRHAITISVSPHTRPSALSGSIGHNGCPAPGVWSNAHGGVVLADEFPEWARDARESLREPLECAAVTLTRVKGCVRLPARFRLAATGNLCPCGGWPPNLPKPSHGEVQPCSCPEATRTRYWQRLSGPVLDRIDLILRLGVITPSTSSPNSQHLERARTCVQSARARALNRWGVLPGRLEASQCEALINSNSDWKTAIDRDSKSLRDRHKTFRVALSLAALDGFEAPQSTHFFEARLWRAASIQQTR